MCEVPRGTGITPVPTFLRGADFYLPMQYKLRFRANEDLTVTDRRGCQKAFVLVRGLVGRDEFERIPRLHHESLTRIFDIVDMISGNHG